MTLQFGHPFGESERCVVMFLTRSSGGQERGRVASLATVADADIVVSWNFRHIVRFDKIRQFNAVNLEAGYKAIAIHSPREVATDDSQGR